jgi:hypothetical protein
MTCPANPDPLHLHYRYGDREVCAANPVEKSPSTSSAGWEWSAVRTRILAFIDLLFDPRFMAGISAGAALGGLTALVATLNSH